MPLTEQQQDDYCRMYTDPEIMRYIGVPLTIEEANSAFYKTVKQAKNRPQKHFVWSINRKVDNRFCGIMGLAYEKVSKRHYAGIMLLKHARLKGLNMEAFLGLMEISFNRLCLDCVFVSHVSSNFIVERMSNKLGFIPCDSIEHGFQSDTVHYSLSKSQYLKKKS